MPKSWPIYKILGTVFFVLIAGTAQAGQPHVPGEVIVKLKDGASAYSFLGKVHSKHKMSLRNDWGGMGLYHLSLKPGQDVTTAIDQLKSNTDVAYAEPNYLLNKASATGIVNSYNSEDIQQLTETEEYPLTDADIDGYETWQSVQTTSGDSDGEKPVVAVVDTGMDLSHEAFAESNAVWVNSDEVPDNGIDDDKNGFVDDVNGWNFVDGSNSIYDDDGHGTHVAGIVLGVGQDIFADEIKESKIEIMPLKFLGGDGVGSVSEAIKAIRYAVNNGADVLNNSWGGTSYSYALHEAVAYSYKHGTAFVAAAGNAASNNDRSPMYPANYGVPHVMSIAATNDVDRLASFSNYGSNSVHVGSPGVYILSTIPGGNYGTASGTSMATPFVAGVAALMRLETPQMLGYQIKSIILDEAETVAPLEGKVRTESRINALSSIEASKTANVHSSQPSYKISWKKNRSPSSDIAGGPGCGLVTTMGGGGTPPWPVIVFVVSLLLTPLVFVGWLKARQSRNRRRYERFQIDSEVTLKVGEKELVGSVSSISLGGAQVNTDALLENGGLVSMKIESPSGEEDIEVTGRVVWSEAQKAYGVAFEQPEDTVLNRIMDWTKSLNKAS